MEQRQPSVEELLARIEELRQENAQLAGANAELQQRIAALEAELAEARQAAARQAAPFRRRERLKKPAGEKKKPGRQPGHEGSYRQPPPQIDETLEVPLPGCPHCGRELAHLHPVEQIIEELPPVQPRRFKLVTYEGVCSEHGPVRSTHPLQTSTAVGAAGTHLGPRAQAVAVTLSHQLGLSTRKTCTALQTLCGLRLTPGGLSQLLTRVARRSESWWQDIHQQIRRSPAVFADETSWYVGRPGWWLWVFTTPTATLYHVDDSRGSEVVQEILGDDFAGMLVTDCLASYNAIVCRKHKCIAHHLRVLKEYEEALAKRGLKSQYLLLCKLQFQDVIATWEARQGMTPEAYAAKVAQLRQGRDNLLEQSPAEPEEVRFRDRLRRQREHLLGCLEDPAAEPTNNRAERDLRPAVMQRKTGCGNRTEQGKTTWERLRSLAATAAKTGIDFVAALASRLQLAPQPTAEVR
jgi:hypothetical protein